jgi:hypothetical protein
MLLLVHNLSSFIIQGHMTLIVKTVTLNILYLQLDVFSQGVWRYAGCRSGEQLEKESTRVGEKGLIGVREKAEWSEGIYTFLLWCDDPWLHLPEM